MVKRPGFAENVDGTTPVVSTYNSTATPLTAASVFTGEWEDVGVYNSLTVAVATDQTGTYTIQFSTDATNIDSTLTRYYRTDLINAPHKFTITRRYARIVFTNTSASDQTYLRIQTIFGYKDQLNVPLSGTIASDYDALVVRPTDANHEKVLGKHQGVVSWHKWGYNVDVDIAASETVWSTGGNMTYMTTAYTLSCVSADVDDTNGGTGAHGIVIYGLDANRKSQIEVVLLNGTTPVVTTSTWLGINRVAVYAAGTSLSNEGDITIRETNGSTIQAVVPLGEGTTQQCIFFTQADHQTLITSLMFNANKVGGSSPLVTIKIWSRSFVSNAEYELFRLVLDTSAENTFVRDFQTPLLITEKSVVWVQATSTVNNTIVTARMTLTEYRDADE